MTDKQKQTLEQRRAEIDTLIRKWEKMYGATTYGSQSPKPKSAEEKKPQ